MTERLLTYTELAAALGITGASARNLVRRRRWRRDKGNDGQARIAVPVDVLAQRAPASADTAPPTMPDMTAPTTAPSPESHVDIVELRIAYARLEEALGSIRAVVEIERERRAAVEADRDAWRTLATRPWWRRWAG